MTTGTTASGSENWETYSDGSELEPERDAREMYYSKVHTTGKRAAGDHGYGHMAPPPKMRVHERIEEGDENTRVGLGIASSRVEGSDAAWSTEQEEAY